MINRESINDALITVRLLFAKLDSRRNRAVVSTALTLFSSSTFLERRRERKDEGVGHARLSRGTNEAAFSVH